MCGIAGYFNSSIDYSNEPKKHFTILNNMIKTLKYRGPDSDDYKIIGPCCFAHTRLAIIDLETGDQPKTITYNSGHFHIVFNGEIYNYKELRNHLLKDGYKFETYSDSEVLLYMYIKYGQDFIDYINGIFSIAIFDETANTLLVYRDRFGIKPLYYSIVKDTFVFASKIDTLFEYPGIRPSIDITGLNEIFSLGPAKTYGSGIFLGIKEVLPGEVICIKNKIIKKRLYYRLKSVPHEDSLEDTIEKTKALVVDTIKMQMVSDVPICTFLSGGIDSSLVSSICAKNLDDKLSTYSFDFVGNDKHFLSNSFQPSQDRPYVDMMIEYLNSNHSYLYCNNENMFDLLEASVDSRGFPTMADVDSSLLFFCKEVSKNHKVTLTGECADEIFGGYPWFHKSCAVNTFPWMFDISFKKSLLNSEFAANLHMESYIQNAYNNTLSEVDIIPNETEKDKYIRKITYLNIRWFMQTLLDRMDRTSMSSGLEARVPFADHRIIDYVYNIPWEYKCVNNVPKSLLREVAKDYLPYEVLNRPKNPYPKTYNPQYEKLLSNKLTEILEDFTSPLRGYLNISYVKDFINSPKEYGKPWYGQLLAGPQMMAYLIQIDYWMRKYSVSI
ncbi:MAG: asparagine synthase (glutamine-hydrolyzing) [Lachnospiraceae bacterium]|nr:asparagine synthase (glutamine-hydrolyzing) [Lachnospiraceae bacterium]